MSKKTSPAVQLRTEEATITPTLAAEWLKRNPGNRNTKAGKIDCYVRAMKAGRWRLTHQGIGFDKDGNLVDGQNRLHAVVISGCTVKMMVTHGLSRDDMMVMDTGTARNPGDMLTIVKGVGHGKARVAAIRVLLGFENGKDSYVADDVQLVEENERHERAFGWFYSLPGFNFLAYAPYMAAMLYAWERKPAEIDQFARLLIEPVGQVKGSVVLAALAMMRNRSTSEGRKGGGTERQRCFRMMLSAAEAYCKGQGMDKIQDGQKGIRYFARLPIAK